VLELLQRAQVADPASLVSGTDLRLWTHRHGSDGFFAAAWERPEA
jgi:16S rRNA (cytosine967-C5)-methyltransferase